MQELNTGDILLFHGEGYWFSYLVEWFTWSKYSHVAMVVKDPIYLDEKLKGIYMIESGKENFPDAIRHRIIKGVQIVDLEEVLKNYDGTVYVRKLTVEDHLRNDFDAILSVTWDKVRDASYDENPWDLIRTAFDINWGNNCRTNSFVCSAFVCFIYEQFQLLSIPLKWDLITPDYFRSKVDSILQGTLSAEFEIFRRFTEYIHDSKL